MEVFLLLYSRAPPLNTGLSEAAHQASWLVTQPPLTTAPSLPLPGAASPWTRTQLFSHAKLIVLLHPKPSANSPPWGSKTRFHSTAQLSLSSQGLKKQSPFTCSWVRLYNFISLPLAGSTQLTADSEQAQQAYPAECFFPSSSSNKFSVIP